MYKITVIIPVYDTENHLKNAIDSILGSSLTQLEIIVVDDGSHGNCAVIVQDYNRNNIRLIKHHKNRGSFQARVTGLVHAKGEYIAFLDPDDHVDPKIYELAYKKAEMDKLDIVMFNFNQIDESGVIYDDPFNDLPDINFLTGREILDEIFIFHADRWSLHLYWNKIIKRDVGQALLPFFHDIGHIVLSEDLLFSTLLFLYLYEKNSISIIALKGVDYIRHPKSVTMSVDQKSDVRRLAKNFSDTLSVFKQIDIFFKHFQVDQTYTPLLLRTKWVRLENLMRNHPLSFVFLHPIIFVRVVSFLKYYNTTQLDADIKKDHLKFLYRRTMQKEPEQISIFGTGEIAMQLYRRFKQNKIDIKEFLVSAAPEIQEVEGIKVVSLVDRSPDDCGCVVITTLIDAKQIRALFKQSSHLVSRI